MSKVNKIDQIKGLIFGEEMSNYESRLDSIKTELDEVFKELNGLMSANAKSLEDLKIKSANKTDRLNESFTKKLKDSQEKHQNQLSRLKERLLNAVDSNEKLVQDKIASYDKKTKAKFEKIETTMSEKISQLEASSMSKDDFSDLLLEMSLRFNNGSIKRPGSRKSLAKEANA